MTLSQSNLNKLNILLQCRGKEYCQKENCPNYHSEGYCGYRDIINILETRMIEAFEQNKDEYIKEIEDECKDEKNE